MYNILVVDDEKLMRTYLANTIPSFTDIFQVSGVARDGREAIEFLKSQHYDVVITDIQMPEIDGLSLARYIDNNYPNTTVIIVSGYNDFEYARKAIKYHVTDYLLKPLVDKDLADLLEKVGLRLQEQAASQVWLTSDPCKQSAMKKELLTSIIEENTALTYELFQKAESLDNIILMDRFGCMVRFSLDEMELILKEAPPANVTTSHLKLNMLIQEQCRNFNYISLYNTDGSSFVLCSEASPESLMINLRHLCHAIGETAALQKLPRLTILCGNVVKDAMDIPLSMQSISEIMCAPLITNISPVVYSELGSTLSLCEKINFLSENIFSDYLTHSVDRLYSDIREFWTLFTDKQTFTSILRCGSWLIRYISQKIELAPAHIRDAFNELLKEVNLYLPSGSPEASAAVHILTSTVSTLFPRDSGNTVPESLQIVTSAKEYILSHYQENISLADVAEYCGITASYLSDLFHKKLKEPYSKYLLRIRMEHAARLLRQQTGIKIYEVAEQTGFTSVKHFNSVFKKYYGTTPTSFIKP